jgi:glycosyltransferase involved in cell wall biosynthesis
MKHVFVIPCYFDADRPVIFDCINSIRKHHSRSDIIVVDSGSKDKTYLSVLQSQGVKVEDIDNPHYDAGAYWHVYKNFPEYDFFYFLHDSTVLKKNIEHLMNKSVTSIGYFLSHGDVGSVYIQRKLSSVLFKYFKFKFGFSRLRHDAVGFDSEESKCWAMKELGKTKYFVPKLYVSLFGPMMAVHRTVMDKLHDGGVSGILPTNKVQQMTMERIFGLALGQEGYDISEGALIGNSYSENLSDEFLVKIILNRK